MAGGADERANGPKGSVGTLLVTTVLGELTLCLRMVAGDFASGADLAQACARWLAPLKALVAALEAEALEGGKGDAASGGPAIGIEARHAPHAPPWDFGSALTLLTVRQREVVGHWLRGYHAGEIGRLLSIDKSTAKTHLRNALRELRASGEPEALRLVERCARQRKSKKRRSTETAYSTITP